MKRLLAFLLLCVSLFALVPARDSKLFENENIFKVCILSNSKFKEENFVVENGNQYLYVEDAAQAKKDYQKHKNDIVGLVLYFPPTQFESVVEFYKIDYYQGGSVEDYQIYYGYSPFYDQSLYIDGVRQNVQIAITQESLIVGFPSIVTGF